MSSVVLNNRAYEHAQELIKDGRFVPDDRDEWSEHQPTAADENAFIEEHGIEEYSHWYLGADKELDEDNKTRYKFPYGDFKKVHRCGVIAAETRAGQYKYLDIEKAAIRLRHQIDSLKSAS